MKNMLNETTPIELKEQANDLYKQGRYKEAISMYSQAIELQPDPTFFSNRSAAQWMLNKYELCLEDCYSALALDSQMAKVISRAMKCLVALGKTIEAEELCEKAIIAAKELKKEKEVSQLTREVSYLMCLMR
jgi:tetratricopeptide (TPR) repeat protein